MYKTQIDTEAIKAILPEFIALDIETTGLNAQTDSIIEFGATHFKNGHKVGQFSQFVNPKKPLPQFISKLTGITDNMLTDAPTISVALGRLDDFIGNKILVCHNAPFDIPFINAERGKENLPPLKNRWLDSLTLCRIYLPFVANHKLVTMAKLFEVELESAHRAWCDAQATGLMLLSLISFVLNNIPLDVNNKLYQLAFKAEHGGMLDALIEEIVNYQRRTALLKRQINSWKPRRLNYIEHAPKRVVNTSIAQVFNPGGNLDTHLSGYEHRPAQEEMANGVLQAFLEENFLLAEAGTGVGKSLAYLVPAIRYTAASGEKVVVSTNTKNLQEQLFEKDLPLLANCLPVPFTATLVKGRDNYLCSRKWESQMFDTAELTPLDAEGLLCLIVWQHFTQTGDITENSSFNRGRMGGLWKRLAADRYNCLGRKCTSYSRCLFMDIRKKSENASLVVVNHSLLLSDILNGNPTLGEFTHLVVDEAHNLPASAAKHLGVSLAYPDAQAFFNRLYNSGRRFTTGVLPNLKGAAGKSLIKESDRTFIYNNCQVAQDLLEQARPEFETVFNRIGVWAADKGDWGKYRVKKLTMVPFLEQDLSVLYKHLEQLTRVISELAGVLGQIDSNIFANYDSHNTALNGALENLSQLLLTLQALAKPDLSNYALWFSRIDVKDPSFPAGVINYAPLEVDQLLNVHLYDRLKSAVFTSATMALRGSFKYFRNRMGLNLVERQVKELLAPSPFDYTKQTLVLAPSFLPQPNDKFFLPQAQSILKDAILTSRVGTLVLFTSYSLLNQVHDYLKEELVGTGITLLAQGKGAGRSALVRMFKTDGRAVLLGTSSFWEGVDVQGDSLQLLILFKLPFAVPSEPLVEAYLEKLEEEGKNSFMHYMMPNALLRYRQGFGRLIRSKSDTGAVLILDSRLSGKQYGKYFMQILPTRTMLAGDAMEVKQRLAHWFKGFNKPQPTS